MGFETWTKEALQELNARHPGGSKLRPSQVRTMSDVERAWVGAFIEADGCAFMRKGPNLNVVQKEIDPLATLLRVTGAGKIQMNSKGIWAWTVWRANDALDIAKQCAPYSWKLQSLLKEV